MMKENSKNARRVAAVVVVMVVAAAGLAACGSSSRSSAPSSHTSEPTGVPSKAVTITFMESHGSGTLKVALAKLTSEFERKYPNIKVDLEIEPGPGVLEEKERAAIAAGDPPTMGEVAIGWAADYQQSHAIVPLAPYMQGKNGVSKKEWSEIWPRLRKAQYLSDHKVWMWPFNISDYVMYFNRSSLDAAGLAVPATWSAFARDAKLLTKDGHWAVSMDPGTATAPANGGIWYLALIKAFGGTWIKNGKPNFDSKAAIEAASYLVKLESEGALKVGTDFPGQTALGAGRATFDLSTIAGYYYVKKAVGGKVPLEVAPFPKGPAGEGNVMAGTNLAIFAKASPEQRSAAWAYMKWLSEPAQAAYWAEHTGYLPVTEAALALMKSYDATHPYQRIAASELRYAEADPPYGWWDHAVGDVVLGLQEILLKHQPLSVALRVAEQKALSVATQG
jgi:multiple sugar transport system substrate-binding protein